MLFVGVGTSMAQDKKTADSDATELVKTETSEKKECSKSESKACCAKNGVSANASKKGRRGKSKKACSMADAEKANED